MAKILEHPPGTSVTNVSVKFGAIVMKIVGTRLSRAKRPDASYAVNEFEFTYFS